MARRWVGTSASTTAAQWAARLVDWTGSWKVDAMVARRAESSAARTAAPTAVRRDAATAEKTDAR
jgi:hypothetical protein